MNFLKENKDVFGFLLKLGVLCGFYFLWFSANVWHIPVVSTLYGYFVHYIVLTLTELSVIVLNLMDFQAESFNLRYIDLYDDPTDIYIKNFCLGIDIMFCFVALIVSYPGKWKDRIWFIPLGLLGIHLLNVGRIVGMSVSWILLKSGTFVDHHDVFNVVAVIFVFLLFMKWVNRNDKEPAR